MNYKVLVRPALNIYLGALALVIWTFAHAAPVVLSTGKLPEATVELHAEACSRGVLLDQINPAFRKQFRDGTVTHKSDGRTVKLCWMYHENPYGWGPAYVIIDEEDHSGGLDPKYFDKEVK